MANKNCTNVGCITWCFHICVHCKMITTLGLISISITLHSHHFFLVVLYGLLDFSSPTRDWTQALGTENAGILTTGLSRNSPLSFSVCLLRTVEIYPLQISSMLFSHSVVSGSLRPHGLQHARLPWPSLFPGACSDSCPLSQWCHPTISSSVILFSSCFPSFSSHQVAKVLELQLQH